MQVRDLVFNSSSNVFALSNDQWVDKGSGISLYTNPVHGIRLEIRSDSNPPCYYQLVFQAERKAMKRKARSKKVWVLKAQELDSIDVLAPENDAELQMVLAIRFPKKDLAGAFRFHVDVAIGRISRRKMFGAVSENDFDEVQRLLDNGRDVNDPEWEFENTPLHDVRSEEMAQLLIRAKADVNRKNKFGETPLFFAKSESIVRILLEANADIHVKESRYERNILFYCAQRIGVAELLIEAHADVNHCNYRRWTPLHLASSEQYARLLIQSGALIHARDNDWKTPLHLAKSASITLALLEAGADLTAKTKTYDYTPFQTNQYLIPARAVKTIRKLFKHWDENLLHELCSFLVKLDHRKKHFHYV